VYEVPEEDRLVSLRLSRQIGFFGIVSVIWKVLAREASTADVTPFSGTVTFQQGQREAFIELYILDDDLPEPIEVK